MRRLALVLALLTALTAGAAPRRRAVRVPTNDWAYVLSSTDLTPDSADLTPLQSMIGNASMVALGEGTHGTHEFFTMKLRIIDFLARTMGFDVLGWEAPFPLVNRIDAYVQGGPGDPRAMLREMYALHYDFWAVEEMLAVVEWMREYNAHRGERPAIHVAGADVSEPAAAARGVVEYLRIVDPPKAVLVEDQYVCIEGSLQISDGCEVVAKRIRDELASREAELTATSSATAFHEALHHATVVVQSRWIHGPNREVALAENALWLREHRSAARKIILWAHNEHVSRSDSVWASEKPMGEAIADVIGNDYFAISTHTRSGSFLNWSVHPITGASTVLTRSFPPLASDSVERFIQQRGAPLLLIPLRGDVPEWLSLPSRYNTSGTTGGTSLVGSLPAKFDAAIYIDETTASHPLTSAPTPE